MTKVGNVFTGHSQVASVQDTSTRLVQRRDGHRRHSSLHGITGTRMLKHKSGLRRILWMKRTLQMRRKRGKCRQLENLLV